MKYLFSSRDRNNWSVNLWGAIDPLFFQRPWNEEMRFHAKNKAPAPGKDATTRRAGGALAQAAAALTTTKYVH